MVRKERAWDSQACKESHRHSLLTIEDKQCLPDLTGRHHTRRMFSGQVEKLMGRNQTVLRESKRAFKWLSGLVELLAE